MRKKRGGKRGGLRSKSQRCHRSRRSLARSSLASSSSSKVNQAIFQQLYPAPFGRDRALPRPRSLARRRGEFRFDPHFEASGQNRSQRPHARGIWVGSRGESKRTRKEKGKIFPCCCLSLPPSFQKRLIDALLSRRQFEYRPPFSSAHCCVTAKGTTWRIRPRRRGVKKRSHKGEGRARR